MLTSIQITKRENDKHIRTNTQKRSLFITLPPPLKRKLMKKKLTLFKYSQINYLFISHSQSPLLGF